jgi:hypothetical protein
VLLAHLLQLSFWKVPLVQLVPLVRLLSQLVSPPVLLALLPWSVVSRQVQQALLPSLVAQLVSPPVLLALLPWSVQLVLQELQP